MAFQSLARTEYLKVLSERIECIGSKSKFLKLNSAVVILILVLF